MISKTCCTADLVLCNTVRFHSTMPTSSTGDSQCGISDSITPKVRGRRRRNYADEDELLHSGLPTHSSSEISDHPDSSMGTQQFQSSSLENSTNVASEIFFKNHVPPKSSGPGWMSRFLLRCLWAPYAGFVVSKLLEWVAFSFYLSGKLSFYYRHSPPPPVTPTGAAEKAPSAPSVSSCLYLGSSPIHGRGIFTRVALPRGTRLPLSLSIGISPTQLSAPRCIVPGHTYLLLFSDTYEKLPDTLHYTHPTGRLLEVVMSRGAVHSMAPHLGGEQNSPSQSFSHVMLNHSCEANVCSGLSSVFWPAALAADKITGEKTWEERIRGFDGFGDPNAFFLSRDVAAGEELTIDYGCRIAPLYATGDARHSFLFGKYSRLLQKNAKTASSAGHSSMPITLCRCRSPSCRRHLYQPPQPLRSTPSGTSTKNDFDWATELFARGYDDECTILSLLPTPKPLFAYLSGEPISSFSTSHDHNSHNTKSSSHNANTLNDHKDSLLRGFSRLPPPMTVQRYKKSTFLQAYRQLFTYLNEIAPKK